MYAVLGASGNTGSVVARSLLSAGKKVRLVVRDASKVSALSAAGAEVVTGAIDDATFLARAFAGATGAYVLLPPDMRTDDLASENRARTEALRSAIAAAKVPHVVLLSSIGAHLEKGTGPIATLNHAEKVLGAIPGTVLTSLRAAYFLENLAGLVHPMKEQGVLPAFSTHLDFPMPMVATADIGETAARALLEPPSKNEVIELSGSKEASYSDAAKAFAAALGRDVLAISVPFDAVVPTLTQAGMSAHMAGLYREMSEGFDAGRITSDGQGRRVRGKIGVEEFARALIASR